MKTESTFQATIYMGLKVRSSGDIFSVEDVSKELRAFADSVGFCVSLTSTEFIYTDGQEPGVIVGIINYPRFPETPLSLRSKAIHIAAMLGKKFQQLRVSVVMPEATAMLESGVDY